MWKNSILLQNNVLIRKSYIYKSIELCGEINYE